MSIAAPIPTALTDAEHDVLLAALAGPLTDPEPGIRQACLSLMSRRYLQRAGEVARYNGWRGSPGAFVLSQLGWCELKAARSRAPMRRRG